MPICQFEESEASTWFNRPGSMARSVEQYIFITITKQSRKWIKGKYYQSLYC